MTIRAWLFDLDGTLASNDDASFAAHAAAFNEVGVALSRADFDAATGLSFDQLVWRVAPQIEMQARPRLRTAKVEHYVRSLHLLRPNHGLIALLRSAHAAGGIKTALVTSATRKNGEAVLAHLDLADCFEVRVFGDDVARAKPDPAGYLLASERLGLSPTECLAFEDSLVGEQAAVAAGMLVVKVHGP